MGVSRRKETLKVKRGINVIMGKQQRKLTKPKAGSLKD